MALVHRPRLLFLDEPTVGADIQSRARILDVVRGLAAPAAPWSTPRTICPRSSRWRPRWPSSTPNGVVADAARGAGQPIRQLGHPPHVQRAGTGAARLQHRRRDGLRDDADAPAREAAAVFAVLGDDADRVRNVDIVRPSLEAAYLALTGRRSTVDPVDIPAATVGGTLYRKELSDALVA